MEELPLSRHLEVPVIFSASAARTDPKLKPARAAFEAEGIQSLVGFPLFSSDRV
jgi:hypothetical protein